MACQAGGRMFPSAVVYYFYMNERSNFIKACRSEPVDRVPVWFMRQAGRSLPGYRELRKKYDVLTLARTPELAAQVCLEPVDRLGVDAAILFADIMLLPIAMGADVKIIDAVGPVIEAPIKNAGDISALRPFEPESIVYLAESVRLIRGELKKRGGVPLIGFSGAPFTLASYLIEGKPTRTWAKTKQFMFTEPEAWDRLMTMLADGIIGYLGVQIDAGAQAVQLFDSWVGCLTPGDYRARVLPHVRRIFSSLGERGVPRIHFGTDTAALLKDFSDVDCEVIGLDWRTEIGAARKIIGPRKALQGNLDPAVLLADEHTIEARANEIIESVDAKKGFIFNLGHGVLPETDDAKLKHLVDHLHAR